MSLVERLFPASELESLRKFTYGDEQVEERATKRRRLDSTCSSISIASTAVDSGYNSENDGSSKSSPAVSLSEFPMKTGDDPNVGRIPASNGQKRPRFNSEPSVHAQPDLMEQCNSRAHPLDWQRRTTVPMPKPSAPARSLSVHDADLEIVSAQHRIALARQRLHSYSGPAQSTGLDRTDLGWTAGPKAACSSNIFTRLFDACGIMNHERNLLSSLASSPNAATAEHLKPALLDLSPEEKREVEKEVQYVGFVIPAIVDEDEPEYRPSAYLDEEDDNGFDDFFKLDEASTPGEGDSTEL